MGDACLSLDGLEGDRFTALDQCLEGLFGGRRLRCGFGLGGGGEDGDTAGPVLVGHTRVRGRQGRPRPGEAGAAAAAPPAPCTAVVLVIAASSRVRAACSAWRWTSQTLLSGIGWPWRWANAAVVRSIRSWVCR